MIEKPQRISYWDLPDTIMIEDGYDREAAPDLTKENIKYIIDQHNNLVDTVQEIIEALDTGFVL